MCPIYGNDRCCIFVSVVMLLMVADCRFGEHDFLVITLSGTIFLSSEESFSESCLIGDCNYGDMGITDVGIPSILEMRSRIPGSGYPYF